MGLSSNNPLWLIEIPPTTTLSSCTTSGGVIGAVIAIRGATVDIGIANEGQMPARCRFDEPELSMAHISSVTLFQNRRGVSVVEQGPHVLLRRRR